jgi:hypothetical protein
MSGNPAHHFDQKYGFDFFAFEIEIQKEEDFRKWDDYIV